RWHKRFADKGDPESVIALKTKFNKMWDKFNIHDLKNQILFPVLNVHDAWVCTSDQGLPRDIWSCPRAIQIFRPWDRWDFPHSHPFKCNYLGCPKTALGGRDADGFEEKDAWLFDLGVALFDNAKWVVSRKCTCNLGDLVMTWNKERLNLITRCYNPRVSAQAMLLEHDQIHINQIENHTCAMHEAELILEERGLNSMSAFDGSIIDLGFIVANQETRDVLKEWRYSWITAAEP
ncbi:hypothetical protein M404DRAFT_144762, partial [Pisolithus tinctorius Marx 270]